MSVAIALCCETQDQCRKHKRDDALFLSSEDEAMPQLFPIPGTRQFQFVC
jgi:hypothetical protein